MQPKLHTYLLTQNETRGWDTYDSCVVIAESEEDARRIHPNEFCGWPDNGYTSHSWALSPAGVQVKLIGCAADGAKRGVVIASFNAG